MGTIGFLLQFSANADAANIRYRTDTSASLLVSGADAGWGS